MEKPLKILLVASVLFLSPLAASADTVQGGENHSAHSVMILAFLATIVLGAKLAGALAERYKQVSVMGELLLGIFLGIPALFGFGLLENFKADSYVQLFAEFGVILLLFQVGLESNLDKMKKVGLRALLVACVGVVVPFLLGTYAVGPLLLPDATVTTYLFLGAALTATSVGLTARVFKDLGVSQTLSAQIVLGAAVIDDVLGLVILAVVSAIVSSGSIGVATVVLLTVKALAFLLISIILGRLLAPLIGEWLSKQHRGIGMKMAMALAFCLLYSYLSTTVGLAPIVGAFAAGLLLDPVHFRRFSSPRLVDDIVESAKNSTDDAMRQKLVEAIDHHRERHVEDLVEGLAQWFVPIFFVITGLQVNLAAFRNPQTLFIALGLTLAAVLGKLVCGFFAGKGTDWRVVGMGMVPRGEVGLIFAGVGKSLGVVNDQAFAAIVVMIILTTVIAPLTLPMILRRSALV